MARSRISAIACRRSCRSPRLPSVTSFSTIGRRSLAFGSVVVICSCLISAAAMLANIARRCSAVRLSLRWALPWRIGKLQDVNGRDEPGHDEFLRSIMVLEALGELVDVLRRPAGYFHAQVQPHLGEHFLDLVERLAPEVGGAQHLGFRL